jgi:putative methionine-R-sulfoxide reductase with GAF domain
VSADTSYDLLEEQVRALLAGESGFIANAANFAASPAQRYLALSS